MNSENKENLSNYKLLKRKPSVCSTSLHFSKLITVVQFFFRVTPILQWFQLNFGAGNFLGRRPGTSALRMLRRLTAVWFPDQLVRISPAQALCAVWIIFELFVVSTADVGWSLCKCLERGEICASFFFHVSNQVSIFLYFKL